MRALFILLPTLTVLSGHLSAQQTDVPDVRANMTAQLRYVETYKTVAITEMQRTGIPASITLAQAILETNGGQSLLAREANNHFGMKCNAQWKGQTFYKDDDETDADGNPVPSCFRHYVRPQDSYADHSKFLKRPRYAPLFRLAVTDYPAWAAALDSAGYSFAEGYGQKLIDIIERFRLFEYDGRKAADFTGDANILERRQGWLNDVPVVLAEEGETPAGLARAYGLQPADVLRFNDEGYGYGEPLPDGAFVFLAEKRDQWSGRFVFHTVLEGESLFSIAQTYGIRLADLCARNELRPNSRLTEGDRLFLREPPPEPAFIVTNEPEPVSHELLLTDAEADMFLPTADPDDPVPTVDLSAADPRGLYTVQAGDTLYAIARRFETTVAVLKQLNRLSGDALRVGQEIRVK